MKIDFAKKCSSCSYVPTAWRKGLSLPFCLFVYSKHDHHCQIVNILWASLLGYDPFDFGIVPFVLCLGSWDMKVKSQVLGEAEKL